MGKINIPFNDANYSIDESALSAATAELKSHLSTVMNGTGAVINLGGVTYNVDFTKLTTEKNDFISHLGKIAGNGPKVVIDGVAYNIDSSKVQTAVSELEVVLGNLHSDDDNYGDENVITLVSFDNYILQDCNGVYLIPKEDN